MENNDPQKLGRIKVYVQAAYGTSSIAELPWAYPKFAKPGDFYVPEIGEAVYVEFYVPMVNRILIIQFGLVRGFL